MAGQLPNSGPKSRDGPSNRPDETQLLMSTSPRRYHHQPPSRWSSNNSPIQPFHHTTLPTRAPPPSIPVNANASTGTTSKPTLPSTNPIRSTSPKNNEMSIPR